MIGNEAAKVAVCFISRWISPIQLQNSGPGPQRRVH
jgi:hypothetical protein